MLTPKEIASKTFDKTFGFGYRMDDVNSFLEKVASSMSELLEINADLEKKLEVLADKLQEYREDEESLRTAILGSQKLGDSVIRESKTKAEIILRDATIKAEAMTNHAKRQIEREQENLLRTQKEVASFKNRLLDMYKQHLELISALPGQNEVTAREQTETQATAQATHDEPQSDVSAAVDHSAFETETSHSQGEGLEQNESEEDINLFSMPVDEEDIEDDDFLIGGSDVPSTSAVNNKFTDMRFGDAFKIQRNNHQSKFKK